MKEIKCLAFDVDGTLTTSNKIIDPRTLDSIQKAMNKGVHIVISSGRNKDSCEFVYKPLQLENGNHFLSLINGQQIYDFQKDTYYTDQLLSPDDCLKIEKVCFKYHCIGRFTQDNDAYYFVPFYKYVSFGLRFIKNRFKNKPNENSMTKSTSYKNKLVPYWKHTFKSDINKAVFIQSESFFKDSFDTLKSELSEYDIMMVGKGWMEIMPKGVNKAKALRKIAKDNGFTMDNIMAFGDAQNDVCMLQECGIGVAMGNARQDVKDIADIVTDTNNDNGIGKIIDQYIL